MVSNSTDRFNGVVASKAIKAPCAVATSAPITLSGSPQTIDGVLVQTGDRVLVRAQANAVENGIYDVKSTAWERAADWDGNRDVAQGTLITAFDSGGNASQYILDTADPITIGSTAVDIILYSQGATVSVAPATVQNAVLRWDGIDTYRPASRVQVTTGGDELRILNSALSQYASMSYSGSQFVISLNSPSHDISISNDVVVSGAKITISGDTLDIVEQSQSAVSGIGGTGRFWTGSGTPGVPLFTDDGSNRYKLSSEQELFYLFDTDITATDPGAGDLKFDNATPASVTNIYINDQPQGGQDASWLLDNLAEGDLIKIVSVADPAAYLIAAISAPTTDNTGWWTLPVTIIHSGSLPPTTQGVSFEVEWLSQASSVPDGTAEGTFLRWDNTGGSWVETATIVESGSLVQIDKTVDIINGANLQVRSPDNSAELVLSTENSGLVDYNITGATVNPRGHRFRTYPVYIPEVAPSSNLATYGQLYVDTTTSLIFFRTDGGVDYNLTEGTSADTNFDINADIAVVSPPSGAETPTALLRWYDDDGSTLLGSMGYNASQTLLIENEFYGASFQVNVTDGGGSVRQFIAATGGGNFVLSHPSGTSAQVMQSQTRALGGIQVFQTVTASGWERVLTLSDIGGAVSLSSLSPLNVDAADDVETSGRLIQLRNNSGTRRALIGHNFTTRLDFINEIHGGNVLIGGEDAAGTLRTILNADPDSVTELRGDTDVNITAAAGSVVMTLDSTGQLQIPDALSIAEIAAAPADTLGRGQLWVNSTDADLYFTDELGNDVNLSGNVLPAGTAEGNTLYWDNTGGNWLENDGLVWDETNQRLAIGANLYIEDQGTSVEWLNGALESIMQHTNTDGGVLIITEAKLRMAAGNAIAFFGTGGARFEIVTDADDYLHFTADGGGALGVKLDYPLYLNNTTSFGAANPSGKLGISGTYGSVHVRSSGVAPADWLAPIQNLNSRVWRFNNPTAAADPGSQFMRANTDDLSTITAFYFDDNDIVQQDSGPWFGRLAVGDLLYVSQLDNYETHWGYYQIDSITDNTGWWTIAVTHVASGDSGAGSVYTNGVAIYIDHIPASQIPGVLPTSTTENAMLTADASGGWVEDTNLRFGAGVLDLYKDTTNVVDDGLIQIRLSDGTETGRIGIGRQNDDLEIYAQSNNADVVIKSTDTTGGATFNIIAGYNSIDIGSENNVNFWSGSGFTSTFMTFNSTNGWRVKDTASVGGGYVAGSEPAADGGLAILDQTYQLPTDARARVLNENQMDHLTAMGVFEFNTSTTAAEPTAGDLRFNSATPASVTAIYVSDNLAQGLNKDALWLLSSLSVGDRIILKSDVDMADYMVLDIDSITDNTTWYNIGVTVVESGSLPSQNDRLIFSVQYLSAVGGITELTGDVTAGPGSGSQAATIADNAVTNAKLADMASNTVKVGLTGGPQNPSDLAVGTNTVVGNFGGAIGAQQVQTAQIADANITFAKIQNVTASRLLGRGSAGGAGAPEEITLGTNLSMSGTTLNATGGGSSTFEGLTDTNIVTPANEDVLVYNSTGGNWENTKTLAGALTFSNFITFSGSVSGRSIQVNDDMNVIDNAAVSIGTGSGGTGDIRILWDGVDCEVTSLAVNQTINWRDGLHHRMWNSGDTDWVDFWHNGTDLIVTQLNTTTMTFQDLDIRLDDNVELQLGTSGDATLDFNGTNIVWGSAVGSFDMQFSDINLDLLDNSLKRPSLQDYSLESTSVTPTGTTQTITYSTSNSYEIDLESVTGNVTVTISGGPPTGNYGQMVVKITQDSTVARTVTWAGGTFRWPGGTAHPMNTTLNGFTIYTFETWDAGTTWWATGADYS